MNPTNNTVRLQSAEKLFERIAADVGPFIQHGYHPEWGPKCADRPPYTPPSNVVAWLRKHEIENPKGRDYEALTKAAKRKPVGYWEDAPRGAKFGGGDAEAPSNVPAQGQAPSSDSDLYEPVGTVPVVGDRVVRVKNDRFTWAAKIGEVFDIITPRFDKYYSFAAQGVAAGELEDKDFGTWRILKRKPTAAPKLTVRACASEDGIPGFRKLCVGDKTFYRNSIFGAEWVQWGDYVSTPVPASWPELPANEAQALWRECAAQLKLNPETGEAL